METKNQGLKNEMRSKRVLIFLLVLLSINFCCTTDISLAAEQLTYRLKWLFNTSAVGGLYANAHGFFADEGLEVTIKAGGPEKDAIKELELGYADFGVASADQVIRALAKGASVVVIAQLFQENPLQWIYRLDHLKLDGLGDLKGRVIGITYGGNDETIMRTILAKGGIKEDEVELFSVRYDYTPFYKRQVDLWPVYRNTQAVLISDKLKDAGETVAFFRPADYGVRFVANSVVTSEKMFWQHPQTVGKFIRALFKGWNQALDPVNRQEAIAILRRFGDDTSADVLVKQLEITRAFMMPAADIPLGGIDVEAWKQTEQVMLGQKVIHRPVFVEKHLKSVHLSKGIYEPEKTGKN